ncbi:MAG TPA: choice-of-anchor J domain-containing protein [Paludibacteraceae bacterium]|nr:choice-of-anchor J domain-containing protein [Paludibacteraceae bacterium]
MKTKKTFFKAFGVAIAVALLGASCTNVEPTPKPIPPSDKLPVSESFATNQGAFTIVDVTLPEGGTYVWKWNTNKYMKASAFISSAKASESWLISPSIDLSSATAPKLTFEHTGKYFTSNKLTEQTLWVSTNYTEGAPSTATWTQLTIPTWPSGNDWMFVSSGAIDLSAYTANSNVRLAFKYASTTAGAATWEFKNLVVKE